METSVEKFQGIAIERSPWYGFYNYYPLLHGEYLVRKNGKRRSFSSIHAAITAARKARG